MTERASVLIRRIRVRLGDSDEWARIHPSSGVGSVLFCDGWLSTVIGAELISGAEVVVKVRPPAGRLGGCAALHRRLAEAWAAGLRERSFDAKVQSATEGGPESLTGTEALERRRRACA